MQLNKLLKLLLKIKKKLLLKKQHQLKLNLKRNQMLNKVHLIGRLTADIELRKTNEGTSFAYFTLAVNKRNNKDEADFISCVV
ncbi:MAG: hypothetical protein DRP42_03590 [Tenericutes bacterium]|nr:MAG: hypothetical protein DRP42_03590 [Mycoplasmatota bacterium]